ncbi:DUF1127 domain-containing protein [Palleronia sp.]|uniref:DUF1127 domain-containing protein n=1 Tax=Palleronia sp. TaxID=1940284 RepID=UPI0035C82B7E
MALYDLHRSSETPRTTVLAYRVASLVFALADGFSTRRVRRASRALMRLSDWQLADIGLTRADLSRR